MSRYAIGSMEVGFKGSSGFVKLCDLLEVARLLGCLFQEKCCAEG
jgi:hypothetical protein